MKAILKYPGGKAKELKNILPHIPKEIKGRYIEPFVGGGSVFFHLNKENSIINDINSDLINFYKEIITDYNSIKEELTLLLKEYLINQENFKKEKQLNPNAMNFNEITYYTIRDLYNSKNYSTLKFSTIFFFLNKTAYGGVFRTNKKGEFNVPFGNIKKFNPEAISKEHINLLEKTTIMNEDYFEVFKMSNEDDFLFLDPPYDTGFTIYGNGKKQQEGFTKQMHEKLADDFKNLKSKALMVIGKTDFIYDLYKDYVVEEYDKKYCINFKDKDKKTDSIHLIIKNY